MRVAHRVLDVLECFVPLLAFIIASSVMANPFDQTRGGNLKRRQYQTYAAITLYVDPTGSNSNACTASGTSACLTLAGALAKLPRFINHNVTINVAAGAYGTAFPDFPGLQVASGITLAITGVMSAFVPSTGTASGTTTAATAGSSSGPATVTDLGQAWTVNNLRGAFISFTSGTLNGGIYPISANTATTVTFPSTTSAGVGAAYSIITPGSTFNSTAASNITGVETTNTGQVALSNLQISRTGASALTVAANAAVSMLQFDVRSTTGTAMLVTGGRPSPVNAFFSGVAGVNVSGTRPYPAEYTSSNVAYVATTGAAFNLSATGVNLGVSFSTSTFESASTTGIAVAIPILNVSFGIAWITCTGGAGSVGLGATAISSTTSAPSSAFSSATIRITGCETGIRSAGRMYIVPTSLAFDTVTTALSTVSGGTVDFQGTTPTFTSVTNELSQDGTAYTFATLTGLPAPQVITNSYGSRFIR